jgi:hypothetical protein
MNITTFSRAVERDFYDIYHRNIDTLGLGCYTAPRSRQG